MSWAFTYGSVIHITGYFALQSVLTKRTASFSVLSDGRPNGQE